MWDKPSASIQPVITFDNEQELKRRFASAWLYSPNDAFKAALSIFGSDTGKALFIASNWVVDSEVLAITKELIEEFGAEAFLPTKEAAARLAFEMANDPKNETRDRIAALKLYGEYRGFIEKPSVHVGDNISTVNKVMIVQSKGSNEDWERALKQQQKRLTDASTKH